MIVDGIGGYSGPFSVQLSSQPLASQVSWADIAQPEGFVATGNLTTDGAPLFKCVDSCPTIGCSDQPSVAYSFTAEETGGRLFFSVGTLILEFEKRGV